MRGADHGVEGLVDALDDLAVVALVLRRVRPGREAALDGGLGEHDGVGHEGGDGVYAHVHGLAQVAKLVLGLDLHLLGEVALSDLVDLFHGLP